MKNQPEKQELNPNVLARLREYTRQPPPKHQRMLKIEIALKKTRKPRFL
jgi:hypothetical protein